jgi:hypothetical protein
MCSGFPEPPARIASGLPLKDRIALEKAEIDFYLR